MDYNEPYSPTNWQPGAPGGTPFTANRMNNMEDGIERSVNLDGVPFANGGFSVLPNGMMIYSQKINAGDVTENGSGTFDDPYRTTSKSLMFDKFFSDEPVVTATVVNDTGNPRARAVYAVIRDVDNEGINWIEAYRASSDDDPDEVIINITAIGFVEGVTLGQKGGECAVLAEEMKLLDQSVTNNTEDIRKLQKKVEENEKHIHDLRLNQEMARQSITNIHGTLEELKDGLKSIQERMQADQVNQLKEYKKMTWQIAGAIITAFLLIALGLSGG